MDVTATVEPNPLKPETLKIVIRHSGLFAAELVMTNAAAVQLLNELVAGVERLRRECPPCSTASASRQSTSPK